MFNGVLVIDSAGYLTDNVVYQGQLEVVVEGLESVHHLYLTNVLFTVHIVMTLRINCVCHCIDC